MRTPLHALALVPVAALALAALPHVVHACEGCAVAALRTAHAREVIALRRYEAFERQAIREGRPTAAALFRALTLAESIHARLASRELERLDANEKDVPLAVDSGSTAENLRVAIDSERWERASGYPYLKTLATTEAAYDAVAAFGFAGTAEGSHAAVLSMALLTLGEPDVSGTFWVCPGCGGVTSEVAVTRCNCGTSGHDRLAVQASDEPPPVTPPTGRAVIAAGGGSGPVPAAAVPMR